MTRRPPWRFAAGAAVLLLLAGRAAALTRTWNLADDFMDGVLYGVTVYPQGPGARAGITLAHQSSYAVDPSEPGGGALTFWSKNPANLRNLPYAVLGHAVVVVGDWIYVMGGCQKDTGGCGAGGVSRTVATVWFHHLEANGDMLNVPWTMANYEMAATQPGTGLGIPVRNHRAVAVGQRIYVVGGATTNCGTAPYPGAAPSTLNVYSTLVDPATGQPGPWRAELPLRQTAEAFGLVYAAGALYALGGMLPNGNDPSQAVQKAEINPFNGSLYSAGQQAWDSATSIPPGNPPGSCSLCSLCTCGACAPCDEACCRALNVCLGWVWISPFTMMRTIGFIGGAYVNSVSGNSCRQFHGTYHAVLNDCNVIDPDGWTLRDQGTLGLFGAGVIVNNGSLVQVGGGDGSAVTNQVLFNLITPSAGTGARGVVREGSGDREELRPADPDNNELLTKASPYTFPVTASFLTAATFNQWAYIAGGAMTNASEPCFYVYRALMQSTSWWVDAGSFLSRAYDLNGTFQLSRVAWSYTKSGAGAGDDWAMLRYRVASPDGVWTCWSPRVPEVASMPASPGYYTYASDAQSVLFREPLIPDTFRYIQFEISLYNDAGNDAGAAPTLPVFDQFEVSYAPVTPPKPVTCPLELYPNPVEPGRQAGVTIRFEVDAAGGEVTARVYNAGGHIASEDSYKYLVGGVKEETIRTGDFAPGAYVVVVSGLARGGGPGLTCKKTGQVLKTVKAKFVVRRRE